MCYILLPYMANKCVFKHTFVYLYIKCACVCICVHISICICILHADMLISVSQYSQCLFISHIHTYCHTQINIPNWACFGITSLLLCFTFNHLPVFELSILNCNYIPISADMLNITNGSGNFDLVMLN